MSQSEESRPQLSGGQRVGVYGGSFDPIHVGHLEPVLAAVERADLSRVLYLPTAFPPHKSGVQQAPAAVRFEMVELALEPYDALQVLGDEMTAEKVFTVDTLGRLDCEFPQVEFVLLLGADSYADLEKWHRWQDIVAGWDIVVLPRPGWLVESKATPVKVARVLEQHPSRAHLMVHEPLVDVSSSEIRRRLELGEAVPAEWLPKPVLSLIRERNLYRGTTESIVGGSVGENQPWNEKTTSETVTIPTAAENQDAVSEPNRPVTPAPNDVSSEGAISPLPPEVALAAHTALDRQAVDLRLLEVAEVCDFADYFIICTGKTDRQVSAIADAIQRKLRAIGEKPLHVEGERRANWVLVDYGHLLVHIFDPQTRDFYRLERLWGDAPRVPHQLFAHQDSVDQKTSREPVDERQATAIDDDGDDGV